MNLIQVQISGLQAQKLDFENNINKFRIAFNALSGRDESAPFDPAAELGLRSRRLSTRTPSSRKPWPTASNSSRSSTSSTSARPRCDLAKTADKPTVDRRRSTIEFRNGFMPDMEKIKGNWTATLCRCPIRSSTASGRPPRWPRPSPT